MTEKTSLSGNLFVEPKSTLVTEKVTIWGHNFQPCEPITIETSLHDQEEKLSFVSKAHFVTSKNGSFNLWNTPSVGGNYTGVDGMGLFKFLVAQEGSYSAIQKVNASTPLEYKFKIFRGHLKESRSSNSIDGLIDTTIIERCFAGKHVSRVPIKTGRIRGTMFIPQGNGPFPAIITMNGGNKMRHVVEDSAGIISNHGFVTLALAYFGVDDLVKNYTFEPLRIEYFEEAIQFVQSRKEVDPNAIGLFGKSKGAEICLAMASYLPQVKSLVGLNTSVASNGTTTEYKSKVTEMLQADLSKIETLPDGLWNIRNTLVNPRDQPNSMHQFEFSKADILLIVGQDDYNWNSELFADIAVEKMDRVGKTNYEVVKYEGLGHCADAPFTPVRLSYPHPLVPKGKLVYFGGKNAHPYLEEMWKKIIDFLHMTLNKKVTKSKI